jgi:hypothetical protein
MIPPRIATDALWPPCHGARVPSKPAKRIAQVELAFSDRHALQRLDDPVAKDLSAVARMGNSLFLASDESAGVERLTASGEARFAGHRHFRLAEFFDLPGGADQEMDIEGLAAVGGYLWIVGSHALKRSKPKQGEAGGTEALSALRELVCEPNRFFLGRVPLEEVSPGAFAPARRVGERRAACLRLDGTAGGLARWIRKDPLLARFLRVPAKENGIDVEGIAVHGERVWLGLRGPVLGGHAVVLDLVLKAPKAGRLTPRRLEPDGRRYRRHLLDTGGLGVRDLRLQGEDLLLLVGPTMALEGTAQILRWRGALHDEAEGFVPRERLDVVADLPYSREADHPEGMELWSDPGGGAMLIVYDAPADARLDRAGHIVRADVVRTGPA